jgi:DNA end-binding protein Ku
MEALRLSLQQARKSPRARPARNGHAGNGRSRDLSSLSKKELDDRARKAGIEGRSKMSKEELAKALAER